ncbi:MAG TPA: DUF1641 domain-containing protein [Bacteroidales bacterium]|nr:DUF1641 domain-containing protein [Bacteroidales bacterium]
MNDRISALEQKIDVILEYVNQQRLASDSVNDMTKDLSLIAKDFYDTSVEELDKRAIEIDPAEVTELVVTFLKNIRNINAMLHMMEMGFDLAKEAGPILNETVIDFTRTLAKLENDGYFEFARNLLPVLDNLVKGLSPKDLKDLADNIMVIVMTIKDITQPEMLRSVNNAVKVYSSMDMDEIPSYSLWRMLKEINTPEMKKALGFAVTFLKNLSKQHA